MNNLFQDKILNRFLYYKDKLILMISKIILLFLQLIRRLLSNIFNFNMNSQRGVEDATRRSNFQINNRYHSE